MAAVLLAVLLPVAGCGEQETDPVPPPEVGTVPEENGPEGTVGIGQAETLEDIRFELDLDQPVPPDFRAAYQRRAPIAVAFYRAGQDQYFPEGSDVDAAVGQYVEGLRPEYPTVEFFAYDISRPGDARTSEELEDGEYGTLATQLGVGFTPFVATLAPEVGEDGDYVFENLYQGYVPERVLDQALFDLSALDVPANTSAVDVTVERVELTETGGGIEYFAVLNGGPDAVDLQGWSLRLVDPETGEVTPDSAGVVVGDPLEVPPDAVVSVGRTPDVTDADGNPVAGTFGGGAELDLSPGDQLALLDADGAVAATVTV